MTREVFVDLGSVLRQDQEEVPTKFQLYSQFVSVVSVYVMDTAGCLVMIRWKKDPSAK